MKMFYWMLTGLLALSTATLGYLMFVRGNVTASADGRTAIILTAGERDLVLSEMRGFLEAVQAITEKISAGDVKAVAGLARKVGAGAANEVPVSLMTKLPLEVKTLGLATHSAFDDLALEAEGLGDGKVVLEKLGSLMQNCTTCHAGYRLETSSAQQGQ